MSDWKRIVGTVAPWIATALGGPLGGMAVEAVANALGLTEKTEDAIKNALAGVTGEQMLALKNADQHFQLRMQELGFAQIRDLEKIAADDRDSARKMQTATQSMVPALLTWAISGAFTVVMFAMFIQEVPLSNRDIIVYMVGQLSGFTGSVVAFWFGTTRESNKKTELLAQSEPIKEAA